MVPTTTLMMSLFFFVYRRAKLVWFHSVMNSKVKIVIVIIIEDGKKSVWAFLVPVYMCTWLWKFVFKSKWHQSQCIHQTRRHIRYCEDCVGHREHPVDLMCKLWMKSIKTCIFLMSRDIKSVTLNGIVCMENPIHHKYPIAYVLLGVVLIEPLHIKILKTIRKCKKNWKLKSNLVFFNFDVTLMPSSLMPLWWHIK